MDSTNAAGIWRFTWILSGLMLASASPLRADPPWPSHVENFEHVRPGEHPRLLFRKSDLPRLRDKAETAEGRAILRRLRECLNGSDGLTLPTAYNPEVGPVESDGAGSFHERAPLGAYTFSHMAGYGLLYQLTGDEHYAEWAKQCFLKAQEGYRDRDRRYAFKAPYGALRAGPVLGWTAIGYDLCYDAWDAEFRKSVCLALAEYQVPSSKREISLATLTDGTMPPFSNHFGMQTGGAALALLAVMNDPWVDPDRIAALLAVSEKSMIRNLTEGFGDGGFFAEGDGTGSMASHIVFLTALQAWRNAAGKDFITPRPNASWTALKWIFLTVPRNGRMEFWPKRGAYPHNVWDRDDKSGAGYFAISLGSVPDRMKPAFLWFYDRHLRGQDERNGTPFDTPSPYPHLAVSAFVNWPLSMSARDPAEVVSRCYRDSKWSFYACRNRWQDENDVVVSVQTKDARGYHKASTDGRLHVAGCGEKFKWVKLKGDVRDWQPGLDGSMTLTMADGPALAVDFSQASGAEAMLVTTGQAEGVRVQLLDTPLTFRFLGESPMLRVDGDRIVVGEQVVRLVDGQLVLERMSLAPEAVEEPDRSEDTLQ